MDIKEKAEPLLRFFWPASCAGCDCLGEYLCALCRAKILPFRPSCFYCGRASVHGTTCFSCRGDGRAERVIVAAHYADPVVRALVRELKFGSVKDIADILAGIMLPPILSAIAGLSRDALFLCPIPLHPRRKRVRGFDQARLMADALSEALGIKTVPLLRRDRYSPPQARLPAETRFRGANIAGSFSISDNTVPAGKIPILVDDVITSGATLSEAVKVVRAAGFAEVWSAFAASGN